MKLHEMITEKATLYKGLQKAKEDFEALEKRITARMSELNRLEKLALENHDIEKIQMAEKVIYCQGNPDALVENRRLTEVAAIDIAMNHPHLAERYYGNKRYENFYQASDHTYGMGPSHGHIVDAVGMKHESRGQMLCDEEKDACIYYLKNYSKIKQAKQT